MLERLRKAREEGAAATEYIIIVLLIAIAIIVGATFLGNAINDRLSDVGASVTSLPN